MDGVLRCSVDVGEDVVEVRLEVCRQRLQVLVGLFEQFPQRLAVAAVGGHRFFQQLVLLGGLID